MDLSHPEGNSVNDGIEPDLCSLTYASIDDAVELVLKMGKGTMLAKLDLESAYRIVPVHLQDRLLLGMKWDGKLYIDSALPFWLTLGPKNTHGTSRHATVDYDQSGYPGCATLP